MHTVAMLALLLPGISIGTPEEPSRNQAIQVWLNRDHDLEFGDRIRVYVKAEDDGHIVVLHADPEGRIRVLFPLDPFGDDFLRGGRDYEIRNRNDDEAIRAVETTGFGTVFVAYSQDPFRFGEFSRGDHWDANVFAEVEVTGDAEQELTEIAQRMANGTHFVYELETYYLNPPVAYSYDRYRHYGRAGARFGISVGFFPRYGYYRYRPYRRYGYFTLGRYYDPFYYDPFYYDPFYYDPFYYDPFYYGYGYGRYGRGYYSGYYGGYGSTVIFTNRGTNVNYNYTFRNRTVAGADYRDRRLLPAGTLARAGRQRVTPQRAEPRRGSALAGRGTPARRAIPRTAPSRGTNTLTENGRRAASEGVRRPTASPGRLSPERRSAAGLTTEPSRSRSAGSSERSRIYRVAPSPSPRRTPSARPQPGRRAQPQERSATTSSRIAAPRIQRRSPSARSSGSRTTTRISPQRGSSNRSSGQLQRRSPSRSSASPSRSARSGRSSTTTSARPARSSGSTRIARPSGTSGRSASRSPASSGSRGASAARSPSRSSSTRTTRSSGRRRPNP